MYDTIHVPLEVRYKKIERDLVQYIWYIWYVVSNRAVLYTFCSRSLELERTDRPPTQSIADSDQQ
jgi:hypothetical protein